MSEMEIEVRELQEALHAGRDVQLVDVRDGWEFALARIPGAVLIPLPELDERLKELDRERDTVVYCHHGVRSLHAALALRSRGFGQVRSLRGGIDRWSLEVDAAVPRY